MGKLVKDVVCGMAVDPALNSLAHLGMDYAFCSTQCRERFMANPHLYVGLPGQKAPKQEGTEILKRRRLRLAQPLSPTQAAGCFWVGETLRSWHQKSARGSRAEHYRASTGMCDYPPICAGS